MDHYQFVFEKISPDKSEQLIALLSNIEFEGFEEVDEGLKAFVKIDEFDENSFDNIIENITVKYSKSIIEEKNWNEQWESGFEPVVVYDPVSLLAFASIRANFHSPVDGVKYDLVITPKMSFGTGHHATTYLMIQQMGGLDFKNKEVIDFGTGTAVLAIFAEKLGASKIKAIDNDEWSINNAKENIAANGCANIDLVKAETIEVGMKADIILANINLNIIIANLDAIKTACKPGAVILFSGIMQQDKDHITTALIENGFIIDICLIKDNWLIIGTKRQ